MPECVLCDWTFDPGGLPVAVFRPGATLPLRWDDALPGRVREVHPTETMTETMPWVALLSHWGTDHADQLAGLIGTFQVSHELVRPTG